MRLLMLMMVLGATAFSTALAAQGQEIDVEREGSSIASGSVIDLGTVDRFETTDVDFTIQNEGSTDLTITGNISVTDTDNCAATIDQPSSTVIGPGGSADFTVHVTNNGGGTFRVDISVPSDDLDEASYAIGIEGVAVTDDTDKDDDDNCSTGGGSGGFLILAALGALGLLAIRHSRPAA